MLIDDILTLADRRHMAAVKVMVRENLYVIGNDDVKYSGLWRTEHCDFFVLDLLRIEVYGVPSEEEFAGYCR